MGKYAKAIVGAIVAAGTAYLGATTDGLVTGEEIGVVVGAFLGGLGIVWAVPNSAPAVSRYGRDGSA